MASVLESLLSGQLDGGVSGRVQLVAVLVTVILFAFVLELVRRRALTERYALLWSLLAVVLLVLAVWSELLDLFRQATGAELASNALFLGAFGVIFVLLLHFSVANSRLGEETKILAQEVARLDQQLRAQRGERGLAVAEDEQDERPVGANQRADRRRAG